VGGVGLGGAVEQWERERRWGRTSATTSGGKYHRSTTRDRMGTAAAAAEGSGGAGGSGSSASGKMEASVDAERSGGDAAAGSSLLQKLNLPLLLEQTLHVSVSSHCVSRAEMCEPPRVHAIAAYRSSDVSLAQFLTAALPAAHRRCVDAECSGGPEAHVRSYIHGGGRLTLRVRSLAHARRCARQAVRRSPPSVLLPAASEVRRADSVSRRRMRTLHPLLALEQRRC
jgi:hypothetical protein